MIYGRDIAIQPFSNGGRPPYWICCGVFILHPRTLFYISNIVLNFQVDWFVTFCVYLDLYVSAFWLFEIAYLGTKFDK